jgi:prepilin-type N-terminal cleavage/methylation domain-containing protein
MNERGMTLVEVLVALVIASGVTLFAMEISRFTVNRSAASLVQLEAVLEAESLLSRVGLDIPLQVGQIQNTTSEGISWVIDIRRLDDRPALPHAYQVSSEVIIARAGISERYRLATIKLTWNSE